MTKEQNPAATKPKKKVGYMNVRISAAAHEEITRRALEEERTFIATLDRIVGV